MKHKTKNERLCAIAHAYQKKFGKTSFTIDEVSEWALQEGLYPCPKRGDPEDVIELWEREFERASAPEPA